MNKFAVLFIICAIAAGSANANWADVEPYCYFPDKYPVSMHQRTVPVDLNLYSGVWYEIVRKPMVQQTGCVCTQAEYTLSEDQRQVKVQNTCITAEGRQINIEGYAVPANQYHTRLNVYFRPNSPGEYWILDIDENYQWVIVGEPCKKSGWVLSRTKTMDPELLQQKIQTLAAKGYDVSNLISRGNC